MVALTSDNTQAVRGGINRSRWRFDAHLIRLALSTGESRRQNTERESLMLPLLPLLETHFRHLAAHAALRYLYRPSECCCSLWADLSICSARFVIVCSMHDVLMSTMHLTPPLPALWNPLPLVGYTNASARRPFALCFWASATSSQTQKQVYTSTKQQHHFYTDLPD